MRIPLLLITSASLLVAAVASADYAALPLEKLVTEATIIARIRVLKADSGIAEPSPIHPGTQLPSGRATCRVVESFRGTRGGAVLTIQFNPIVICPGVVYRQGEECVVFLKRKGEEPWQTVNWDNGKKVIKSSGDVTAWQDKIRPLLRERDEGTK